MSAAKGGWIIWALLLGPFGWSGPLSAGDTNFGDCTACHEGIERISPNHDFQCARCHLEPADRAVALLKSHDRVVRNPSDPDRVRRFCMPCHRQEIQQLETSLHSTMAGIINQTRYLWGAQRSADLPLYGVDDVPGPLPLPDSSVYPDSPAALVDDFLRRRCLRCHIHSEGPAGRGLYRGTGCAACHVLYGDEGRYEGADRAIDPNLTGYPLRHEFTPCIPAGQCLHCHNHNHVGTDYVGLFERDYSSTYRYPSGSGKTRIQYGLDHHELAPDIHGERGMWCVDCHGKNDVMGDGTVYGFQMAVPKKSCTDCHGGFGEPMPDVSIPAIRPVGGEERRQWEFVSKNQGRVHPLPLFSPQSVAHSIRDHKGLRCSGCHAQWSFQDYGLSVIRIDGRVNHQWHHLTVQGDPYVQDQLEELLGARGGGIPFSRDWVSGNRKKGIWLQGWRLRRWEQMPLGRDNKDKVAILRPLYQFMVSYVDGWGNTPLDSVTPRRGDGTAPGWAFMPYVPHTISPYGRFCDSCHGNRVAAGLGVEEEFTEDTRLTMPAPPALEKMRLLNGEERSALLEPSKRFRRKRLEALEGAVSPGEP